jgi:predicted permease
MSTLLRDLRFGWRQLTRNPGFTVIAVITLALGIGANTAIFSIINGVFLRGLPAENPNRLVGLSFHQKGGLGFYFSYPNFQDIRQQANRFSSMLACVTNLDGLSEGDRADQVITSYVTGNYFTTLGLKPALGRLILPSEGKISGSDPVLVLGYSYWKERFGSDPGILGKQVEVDGHPLTIVGVAPEGFRGLTSIVDVQAYIPLNMMVSVEARARDWASSRDEQWVGVVGRLKRGASMDDAQASLDVIARRLAEQYPKDDRGATIGTYPGIALRSLYQPTRQRYKIELIAAGLFLGLAALVLLLACFNVANLLLVRATAREHEMAVRAALGAGRGRLTRQVLTESLLLAFLGGVAGILLGDWGNSALSAIHLQMGFPIHLNFGFDGRDLAFAIVAAVLAGIVVGAVPAVRAARADPSDALHEGGRGIVSGRHRLRNGLVIAEIAGSVVLLVVAGLFTRSLEEVQRVELGFNPGHVLNLTIDPHDAGYDEARGRVFFHDLLRQVRALQGVKSASLAFSYPASYYSDEEQVYVEGRLPPPGQAGPRVQDNFISPGYFRTLGIRIVEGRGFADTDTASAPNVAVINQTMARDFWPGEDPIGRHFKLSSIGENWIQVVGVARDSRYVDLLASKRPYFYIPLDQNYAQLETLQVRTLEPPETMITEIEQPIHSLAPGLPVFGVQTMNQALDSPNGFFHYRLGSGLAAALGLLGLILAVVGVYGVVSYTATQRTHEVGIRMALGAQASDIWKMVLGQGLTLAGEGVLVGLLAAFAVSRLMAHIVFGVSTYDPLTFGGVTALLAVVVLVACYIPARRAANVDPMVALRYE